MIKPLLFYVWSKCFFAYKRKKWFGQTKLIHRHPDTDTDTEPCTDTHTYTYTHTHTHTTKKVCCKGIITGQAKLNYERYLMKYVGGQ